MDKQGAIKCGFLVVHKINLQGKDESNQAKCGKVGTFPQRLGAQRKGAAFVHRYQQRQNIIGDKAKTLYMNDGPIPIRPPS